MKDFLNFIIADYNMPFFSAIILMLFLSIFEKIANLLLTGKNKNHLCNPTGSCQLFTWIYIGIAPIVIFMIMFSAIFGLTGYFIQYIMLNYFNSPLNVWMAVIIAFVISWIPMCYWISYIGNKNMK